MAARRAEVHDQRHVAALDAASLPLRGAAVPCRVGGERDECVGGGLLPCECPRRCFLSSARCAFAALRIACSNAAPCSSGRRPLMRSSGRLRSTSSSTRAACAARCRRRRSAARASVRRVRSDAAPCRCRCAPAGRRCRVLRTPLRPRPGRASARRAERFVERRQEASASATSSPGGGAVLAARDLRQPLRARGAAGGFQSPSSPASRRSPSGADRAAPLRTDRARLDAARLRRRSSWWSMVPSRCIEHMFV